MSQIEELQGRITAAMERISAGLAALAEREGAADVSDDPAAGDLAAALEEEKLANAQLAERLRTLKSRHEEEIAALKAETSGTGATDELQAEIDAQAKSISRLDEDLQRLRQANDQLRESNAALRQANEVGVGEPHLINKAMLAELESLRAARAAEQSEAGAILAKLEPLLQAADAQSGGEGA